MAKARRATLTVLYESVDISKSIAEFFKSFSFEESLGGAADRADITLHDREELWVGDWMPDTNATLNIDLSTHGWQAPGYIESLRFGKFYIDELTNSCPPWEVQLKCISIPANTGLAEVKHSRGWEKVALSKIVQDVADGAGVECYYDTEEDPVLERCEQSEETDLAFLQKQCSDAGLYLKVTDSTIVVFDVAKYEQRDPVLTIDRQSTPWEHFSGSKGVHNIYRACHVKYKHGKSDELIEYTFEDPNREKGMTLEVNEKVENIAEAEKLAKKKLHEKNLEEYRVSLTMPGSTMLLAGCTVTLKNWHTYDGKYLVVKSGHSIDGSGYTTKIELRRVIDGY